jgi:hypothetical protein
MHPRMCRNGLAGLDHLDYTIGITDKRISIDIDVGIWSCTNAMAGVFV